mgnify:CR=1 FL=1
MGTTVLFASTLALLQDGLLAGSIIFCLGLIGALSRRNLIVIILSVGVMIEGIAVNLVSWSRYHGDAGGLILVAFIFVTAICKAILASVLIKQAFARVGNLDSANWQALREATINRTVDHEIPLREISKDNFLSQFIRR